MSGSGQIIVGDCVEEMAKMPADSVDAIVTDPPYGLEFMGKEWDKLNSDRQGHPLDPSGQHMNRDPWEKMGKVRPAGYAPKKNPRCRKCGKLNFNTERSKCKCKEPDFDYRHAEQGFRMQAWHEQWAREAFSVLKPGGHLLAFGGTRTYHRMVCAIEDAGFEIRDRILHIGGGDAIESMPADLAWAYGSG